MELINQMGIQRVADVARFLSYVLNFWLIISYRADFTVQFLLLLIIYSCIAETLKNKNSDYFKLFMFGYYGWMLTGVIAQYLYYKTSFSEWTNWHYPVVNDFFMQYSNLYEQLGLVLFVTFKMLKKVVKISQFICIPLYICVIFFVVDLHFNTFDTIEVMYIASNVVGCVVGGLLLFDKRKTNDLVYYKQYIFLVLFFIIQVNLLIHNIELFQIKINNISYVFPMLGGFFLVILKTPSQKIINFIYSFWFPLILITIEVIVFFTESSISYLPMHFFNILIFSFITYYITKYKFKTQSVRSIP